MKHNAFVWLDMSLDTEILFLKMNSMLLAIKRLALKFSKEYTKQNFAMSDLFTYLDAHERLEGLKEVESNSGTYQKYY